MKKFLALLTALIMAFSLSVASFAADETKQPPFENSQFFQDGDYTLHYRVFEPEGEMKNQIILLHGFGLSTVSFEGLATEYVKNGSKVVLVDLPNFGYSSRETTSTNLVDREELVFDLMQSLGGTWIVGGHSMGGGIAANIAIEHEDAVSGLLLFAPQTSTQLSSFSATLAKSAPVRLTFEMLIRAASHMPSVIKAMVAMSFSSIAYAEAYDVSKISAPLQIKGTGSGIAIMASHAKSTDIQKFANLKIPVVIVTASNDSVASKSNLNALINAAPQNLTVCNLESGGHMMMEYAPAETAAATMQTIAAASLSSAA